MRRGEGTKGSASALGSLLRATRSVVVAVVGLTVVAVGIAMLVLPGPALVVIPAGLAILGLEFAWARRWLETIRAQGERAFESLRRGR